MLGTSFLTSCQSPTEFLREVFWAPCYLSSTSTICQASNVPVKCHSTQTTQELTDWLNLVVAKWLNEHKLTLNLDKTKCMLIGSNGKIESKVGLTVSI